MRSVATVKVAVLPLPGSPPMPVIAVPSVAWESGVSVAEPASSASCASYVRAFRAP